MNSKAEIDDAIKRISEYMNGYTHEPIKKGELGFIYPKKMTRWQRLKYRLFGK